MTMAEDARKKTLENFAKTEYAKLATHAIKQGIKKGELNCILDIESIPREHRDVFIEYIRYLGFEIHLAADSRLAANREHRNCYKISW